MKRAGRNSRAKDLLKVYVEWQLCAMRKFFLASKKKLLCFLCVWEHHVFANWQVFLFYLFLFFLFYLRVSDRNLEHLNNSTNLSFYDRRRYFKLQLAAWFGVRILTNGYRNKLKRTIILLFWLVFPNILLTITYKMINWHRTNRIGNHVML